MDLQKTDHSMKPVPRKADFYTIESCTQKQNGGALDTWPNQGPGNEWSASCAPGRGSSSALLRKLSSG